MDKPLHPESYAQLTTWRATEHPIPTRGAQLSLQETCNRYEIPRDGCLSSYEEHSAQVLGRMHGVSCWRRDVTEGDTVKRDRSDCPRKGRSKRVVRMRIVSGDGVEILRGS